MKNVDNTTMIVSDRPPEEFLLAAATMLKNPRRYPWHRVLDLMPDPAKYLYEQEFNRVTQFGNRLVNLPLMICCLLKVRRKILVEQHLRNKQINL